MAVVEAAVNVVVPSSQMFLLLGFVVTTGVCSTVTFPLIEVEGQSVVPPAVV